MRHTAKTVASTIRKLDERQQTYTVRLLLPNNEERVISVSGDEFILAAAYREGIDLPSMCLQGWCVTCAGRVEGEGAWDQSASLRYYDADRQAGFILLCTAQPRSDLVIRTHQRVALRDYRTERGLPVPRG